MSLYLKRVYYVKGLDKDAKPPPPPSASVPRTPSDKETKQSVKLQIQGLNISQVGSKFLLCKAVSLHRDRVIGIDWQWNLSEAVLYLPIWLELVIKALSQYNITAGSVFEKAKVIKSTNWALFDFKRGANWTIHLRLETVVLRFSFNTLSFFFSGINPWKKNSRRRLLRLQQSIA